MRFDDFSKDVQRLLLSHWSAAEINDRLIDPEYFFDQVVIPRLDYLRRQGEEAPRLRIYHTPNGDLNVVVHPQ
ncbi:MAG: hypothetical protein KCHDKBKB_02590 [Elusimicrobia bacterium]|nr:hypothetical protein [Elusimicrobiota bacterium]